MSRDRVFTSECLTYVYVPDRREGPSSVVSLSSYENRESPSIGLRYTKGEVPLISQSTFRRSQTSLLFGQTIQNSQDFIGTRCRRDWRRGGFDSGRFPWERDREVRLFQDHPSVKDSYSLETGNTTLPRRDDKVTCWGLGFERRTPNQRMCTIVYF